MRSACEGDPITESSESKFKNRDHDLIWSEITSISERLGRVESDVRWLRRLSIPSIIMLIVLILSVLAEL